MILEAGIPRSSSLALLVIARLVSELETRKVAPRVRLLLGGEAMTLDRNADSEQISSAFACILYEDSSEEC